MSRKCVKRRIACINVFFILIMCLLFARLAYIQILGHEELASAALRQQQVRVEGADARGIIYDRNGVPLTGENKDYVYIIDKKIIEKEGTELLAQYDGRRISNESVHYAVYTFSEFNPKADRELREKYDAYVMEAERRYSDKQTAAHLLGYLQERDGSGVSGVELAFNDVLSERKRYLYASADAMGKILPGIGLSGNIENGTAGIVTTLDVKIQEMVEKTLEETDFNGAVVILESKTGQILAASSTPVFNPNRIRDYIDSNNSELVNKVIQGEYPPGSIYKIIVAAAALESDLKDMDGEPLGLDSPFYCEGSQEVYGLTIKCSTGGESGHGEITLKDAFAKSCNSAFIQLGELIGGEAILEMSSAFGMGQPTLSDISSEKLGYLTKEEDTALAGIGNLSIGQGSLLATPIQMAKMTNIIANMGEDVGISLLKDLKTTQKRVISKSTAQVICHMMEATMVYGTGNNISPSVHVAGKTGSAQARLHGKDVVHGWFTGFFPAGTPKYTVTVFMENGRSGRLSAVPVFEKIEAFLSEQDDKA